MNGTYAKPDTLPQLESMDTPSWRQAAKDLPISIAASALGFGVAKTLIDHIGNHTAEGKRLGAAAPAWLRYIPPAVAAINGFATNMAAPRVRGLMKERRDAARLQHERGLTAEVERLRAQRAAP